MRDPGLQAERTILSWGRTLTALVINVVLLTRVVLTENAFVGLLVGVVLLIPLMAIFAAFHSRSMALHHPNVAYSTPRLMALTAGMTAFCGAVALVALTLLERWAEFR